MSSQDAVELSMAATSVSTRQRLIKAALELFLSQGVSGTTTRQIANLAEVNEVTLFRHFGNKHGLLLAVLTEAPPFADVTAALQGALPPEGTLTQGMRQYASKCLQVLQRYPELVRSLIGEADQYPPENRQALGQRLTEVNRVVAQQVADRLQQSPLGTQVTPRQLISLVHSVLIGYAVIEFTSDDHGLWQGQSEFVMMLEQLLAPEGMVTASPGQLQEDSPTLLDLPASLVHTIIQTARKSSSLDYALAYVLFAAGLSATDMVQLQRSDHISDDQQQVLLIHSPQGIRQVPINQWILGKRYGSYTNNPLTKWLKSRKDDNPALFLNETGQALTVPTLQQHWHQWTRELLTPGGHPPSLEQAQQTWCVEMLMRGLSLDNLSILTRQPLSQLQPYADRAREKVALDQAAQLDRKPQ